jgi:putative hemolysin
VAGHTELAQITEQLHADIEGRDYSTVAGLLLARLGRVPKAGEAVEQGGVVFEVLEANQRKVLRVRLRLSPDASPALSTDAEPHAN